MAKGNKRKGRKHGDSSSSSDDEELAPPMKDLDFAQRRELQRKAASEKRRSKQRCHLCGETGHVRRECPGIEDGGRGASKFTKKKGDSGATHLGSSTKGAKNRGRKKPVKSQANEPVFPPFPPGFSKQDNTASDGDNNETEGPFLYYDASCDITATIDYLRMGRGKNKLSNKEAVALYQQAIETATTTSNYGGCISRSLLKPGRPWTTSPLALLDDACWFVVGMGRDFLYNDEEKEAALASLLENLSEHACVVGFFADLDYSPETLKRPGCGRESQLQRLACTCQAAADANVSIQIRTSPGGISSSSSGNADQNGSTTRDVMKDLRQVLSETIATHPTLKVHLSCWTGGADEMMTLLKEFPDNAWFGFDATVTFAKAAHVHECAFDVPLSRVLLETGANTIPSIVTKSMGRDAFSYPGLVPFVADAIANRKRQDGTDAAQVARTATENTLKLYPQLVVDDKKLEVDG